MKTALLSALPFLLLFAFSTQRLTLASELVRDIYGNPLVPRHNFYYILNASNHRRGIQLERIVSCNFPVRVVIGTDPKNVRFRADGDHIDVGESVDLEFSGASPCAANSSHYWKVDVPGDYTYPVVICGNDPTVNGSFCITKPKDEPPQSHKYYIAFKFYEKDNYNLTTTEDPDPDMELYRLDFCERGEKLKVVFSPDFPPRLPRVE